MVQVRSSDFPQRSDTASKLPSYRHVDLVKMTDLPSEYDNSHGRVAQQQSHPQPPREKAVLKKASTPQTQASETAKIRAEESKSHRRHHSANDIKTPDAPKAQDHSPSSRPKTSSAIAPPFLTTTGIPPAQNTRPKSSRRSSKVPASHSRKDVAVS